MCDMSSSPRDAGRRHGSAQSDSHRQPADDIAANSYPNNDAYLEAWITHAQSLKPEAQMPDITQFYGQQLRNIVAYLRQLQ